MTPFASVALFRRDKGTVFKAPRREASPEKTQARKSASRYWSGVVAAPDRLERILLVQVDRSAVRVSWRDPGRKWAEYSTPIENAAYQPHLAACLAELGVDPATAPPPLPDVIEINGVMYRRDI